MLAAASGAYLLGLKANLAVYEAGLLARREPALPTVSIGNLTLGGTGKTTATRHLARRLLEGGLHPGIVLRGHRGSVGAASLLAADGERILSSVQQAGDEAVMLARTTPGCAVAVGKRREAVVKLLADTTGTRVALLDDGFQYFRMERIADLLLVDTSRDLAGARAFPAGYLREPVSHARRATHILLTHTDLAPRSQTATATQLLRRANPTAPLMLSRHVPTALYEPDRPDATRDASEVAGLSVVAVSAIGNPGSFGAVLMDLGARAVTQVPFPDHHDYVEGDWERVREAVRAHSADRIVVTEKDAVKLPVVPPDLPPVLVLVVDLEITHGREEWEALVASIASVCR